MPFGRADRVTEDGRALRQDIDLRRRSKMDALFLVGRFLFGLLFVMSGLAGHFAGYQQLEGLRAVS
jgi:uncharacterized membrane protein YphA (DoxX/SURF4 family)